MLFELAVALALVLVIEGLMYAVFPKAMKKILEGALSMSPSSLRSAGLLSAIIGVGLVWLLRG